MAETAARGDRGRPGLLERRFRFALRRAPKCVQRPGSRIPRPREHQLSRASRRDRGCLIRPIALAPPAYHGAAAAVTLGAAAATA